VRSPAARAAIVVAAIAAVVVLFIVFTGGDDDNDSSSSTATSTTATTAPKPAVQAIVVSGGKPVGGVKRLSYNNGDQVRFSVQSDVADEIHVHGYDLKKDVPAGGTVSFSFPANIEGVFEIELEEHKEQIAELRVSP
jgi:heme/copper-type cytochrome/quinol oxidase subunit 2